MDNKELEGLLLYAGVGVFILFLLFSLFSVWANAAIFSWLTVKYLLMMGAAALALMLEDSARRRYVVAFAAFLGVLALGDQVTYHGRQIDTLARNDIKALEDDKKDMEKELARADDEAKELEELENLRKHLKRVPKEAFKKEADAGARDDKVKELDKKIEDLEKKLKDEVKIELGDLEDMAELEWEIAEEKKEVDEKETDLTNAKTYDAFILLGGFLMLAGALVGGASDDDGPYSSYGATYGASTYTPPSAPPAPSAPAAPAAPAPKPEAPPAA